jgi:hypothetical protein
LSASHTNSKKSVATRRVNLISRPTIHLNVPIVELGVPSLKFSTSV